MCEKQKVRASMVDDSQLGMIFARLFESSMLALGWVWPFPDPILCECGKLCSLC